MVHAAYGLFPGGYEVAQRDSGPDVPVSSAGSGTLSSPGGEFAAGLGAMTVPPTEYATCLQWTKPNASPFGVGQAYAGTLQLPNRPRRWSVT